VVVRTTERFALIPCTLTFIPFATLRQFGHRVRFLPRLGMGDCLWGAFYFPTSWTLRVGFLDDAPTRLPTATDNPLNFILHSAIPPTDYLYYCHTIVLDVLHVAEHGTDGWPVVYLAFGWCAFTFGRCGPVTDTKMIVTADWRGYNALGANCMTPTASPGCLVNSRRLGYRQVVRTVTYGDIYGLAFPTGAISL